MTDTRETILTAARARVQAHGYGSLSFRELAKQVGVKSASIHYHFPTKADLGAALARRYCEEARATLDAIGAETAEAGLRLRKYAEVFRRALENGNRMCMCGFMAAEYDDVPDGVKAGLKAFGDLNVDWLTKVLSAAAGSSGDPAPFERRARAIYAAIGGAQLAARSRNDISLFDDIIETYRICGLMPA